METVADGGPGCKDPDRWVENGVGLTAADSAEELARVEAQFPLLPDLPALFGEWRRLVTAWPASIPPDKGLRQRHHRLLSHLKCSQRFPGRL